MPNIKSYSFAPWLLTPLNEWIIQWSSSRWASPCQRAKVLVCCHVNTHHDHGGITSIPGDGQGVWVTFFLNVPHGSLSCKIASGCKYKPKYLQHFNWRQELSNQTVKVPHVKVVLVAWESADKHGLPRYREELVLQLTGFLLFCTYNYHVFQDFL